MDEFQVRLMRQDETETTFNNLIGKEGWDMTLKKFAKFAETFPNLLFVAINKQKEIVGTVSFASYSEGAYHMGNVVVAEKVRRMGLGKHMIRTALASLPEGASISFFVAPGIEQFYSDLGFGSMDPSQAHELYHLNVDMNRLVGLLPPENVTVVQYTPDLLKSVQAFDSSARGHNVEEYVRVTVEASDDCLVALNKETNAVLGYVAALIKGKDALICDGLYAESDEIATSLFRELLTRHPNLVHNVKIEIPPSRRFLLQFSDEAGIQLIVRYPRFFRGTEIFPSFDKLYCVTGPEYSC